MPADRLLSEQPTLPDASCPPEERLERGEIVRWPVCPFPLPAESDRQFLCSQKPGSWAHKNISYDPRTGRLAGFRWLSALQADRLREVLAAFSRSASRWLADVLPRYAAGWCLDRASFRPEEEAIRPLRWKARNDLLHIDAFPTRPTNGWRILRLFVNLHPTDPRVWATSETFPRLLERYGKEVGLPTRQGYGRAWRWRQELLATLFHGYPRRSVYDTFMLRMHHFLKANDEFQERCPKRYWSFPPGSAWLLFSDGLSYADLRGQHALEHSYFVAPTALLRPDQAPAAHLQRLCQAPVLNRAA
jgi:hypothetical protein